MNPYQFLNNAIKAVPAVSGDGTVGLFRIEASASAGTGKLKAAGGVNSATKECIRRAFGYSKAHKAAFGMRSEVDTSDFHVEVIDPLDNKADAELGIAFFVAAFSTMRKTPVPPCHLRVRE